MGAYTAGLEERIYQIYPEDDDYIDALLEVVKGFRSFEEALESFLLEHGYKGDIKNKDEKIAYFVLKFRQSGIAVPRNIKKWFREPAEVSEGGTVRINRETAYQICFAFRLGITKTEDFFRRIYLQRSFDRHDVRETVYFHALKYGMTYAEALDMLSQVPETEGRGKVDFDRNICYTAEIAEETDKIVDAEELVAYLKEHRDVFACHNVTAYRYIHKLWEEIASPEGLALQEKNKLYLWPEADSGEQEQAEKSERRKDIASRIKSRGAEGADSLWGIYLQILGLSGAVAAGLGTDRSLKTILRDNALLHPFAEDCFPDRDGLNKILNGENVSYERVRKIMILLVFYKFWVAIALKIGGYQAKGRDRDRCIAAVNDFLTDAGYPVLYAGNPFDWIIMYASADEYPLLTFRDYMRELFYRSLKA